MDELIDGAFRHKVNEELKRKELKRVKMHFRSVLMRTNAGMDFPICYQSAKLIDTDKARLPTTGDKDFVTCKRCIAMLEKIARKESKPTAHFELRREYLNSGGYTRKGEYFGVGMPLYYYYGEPIDSPESCDGHVRAWDRDCAKAQVRALFKDWDVRFYR